MFYTLDLVRGNRIHIYVYPIYEEVQDCRTAAHQNRQNGSSRLDNKTQVALEYVPD